MSVKHNLNSILIYASLLMLIPPYLSKNGKFKPSRIRAYISMLICAGGFAFSVQEVLINEHSQPGHYWILNHIITTMTMVFTVSNSFRTTKIFNDYQTIFDLFDNVDNEIFFLGKVEVPAMKYTPLHLGFITCWFAGTIVWDGYNWYLSDKLYFLKILTAQNIMAYLMYVIVALEVKVLNCTRRRFSLFNELMDQLCGNSKATSLNLPRKVEILTNVHGNISNIIGIFNGIFGWHILFVQIYIIFNILIAVDTFVNQAGDVLLSANLLTLNWLIFLTLHGIYITIICEHIVGEGRRAITICSKAVHLHLNEPQNYKVVSILSHQVNARIPVFSAAGFFNIDYAMLFNFINIITTYVIVLVQFSSIS